MNLGTSRAPDRPRTGAGPIWQPVPRWSRQLRLPPVFLLALTLAAGGAYLALDGAAESESTVPDQDTESGPLVLDRPGQLLQGEHLDRPVEIAAADVTLRGLRISSDAAALVTVRPGITGARIEETELHCAGPQTDGIVSGGYVAVQVEAYGCGKPFAQRRDAPAAVIRSRSDGVAYRLPAVTETDMSRAAAPARLPLEQWPGPTSTGVPPGTQLRKVSGKLRLNTDGEVVSGIDLTGCVEVRAKNVTIEKSRITCDSSTFSIRTHDSAANLLISDVEIDGTGRNSTAICCANYTARRVNIHHALDGPRLSDNTVVEDSWIHSLSRQPGSHNDTLQITGGRNVLVRGNRLDAYRDDTDDPMNACIMIGSTTGVVRDVRFVGNYCDGGNYSVHTRADLNGANILIRDNRYGRNQRYGVVSDPDQAGILFDQHSNVWFDNVQPVLG
ncbi:hypothetical protein [Melissospora conviva]|uniref:hypothetical protein n=1 Tax=Melissospora conviva TaxID=3388432 RepID=UPI003C251D02